MRVDGQVIDHPYAPVVPETARISLDDEACGRTEWRTILFHKPRGIITTRSDPEKRTTVYDVLGETARGLVAVGRLDLATSGLLLLTSDTRLANWLTDPDNHVPRVYIVTVRGLVTDVELAEMRNTADVQLRKSSQRESHLTFELTQGKNRQVRRLCEAAGHEVTRLKRVRLGELQLGDLAPGTWREVAAEEIRGAFPRAALSASTSRNIRRRR